jgi:hypothetical protein
MPTPEQVTSTATRLVVWEVDDVGNTRQDGGVMLKARATPTPTPAGYLQLYSPDGTTLAVATPNGATVAIPSPDASGSTNLVGATSTTKVLDVRITGNTAPQFDILASGKLEWGDGTAAVSVNLFRDGSARLHTTNDFVSEGNLIADIAGKGLNIREGTNARMGTATLNGTTAVTVTTTAVTANSRIMLTIQVPGGTPAGAYVFTRTAGTSFQVKSFGASDTSVIAWVIIEPAT